MDHKKKRRSVVIAALVLCLAAVTGLGTLAWMTAQDSATNAFTLGNFSDPDKEPDPENPEQGDTDGDENLDGYLTETKWVKDSKLYEDAEIAKNPNVGIGKGSDDAYIFVYVDNNMTTSDSDTAANSPYFTINENWAPVEGYVQEGSTTLDEGATKTYTGGLFVYTGGTGADPAILEATDSDAIEGTNPDVYTGELFSEVVVPDDANFDKYATSPTMNVYALLYSVQYSDGTPVESGDGSAAAAVEYAKTWNPTQAGA